MNKNNIKTKKETLKDTERTPSKLQDDKDKATFHNVSTPRPFVSKTAADIYGDNKKHSLHNTKALKKLPNTSQTRSNITFKNDISKQSPATLTQNNSKVITGKRDQTKTSIHSARQTSRVTKPLSVSSVTVNSPAVKRKLQVKGDSCEVEFEEAETTKRVTKQNVSSKEFVIDKTNKGKQLEAKKRNADVPVHRVSSKEAPERQRTQTRTLSKNEVRVLSAEMVDNNVEMLNLSRKLTAKPKAFYIDLEEGEQRIDSKVSTVEKTNDEEEVSYEDDFESYESDFESYRSETDLDISNDSEEEKANEGSDAIQTDVVLDPVGKEVRDEERMLDSGSYDLRDRSAKTKPTLMENILEDAESLNDKKASLTDEGFQEMSSSSNVSSIKTVNVDLLDRPLFIDFAKSKQNKRKMRIFERLKQRAYDLLSMINLHEMSYSVFEMQPIAYDTYMATFGRSNYTQTSVQTNEDRICEETQTDEIHCVSKWTQNPVEFSNHCMYLSDNSLCPRKYSQTTVDYRSKFEYLLHRNIDNTCNEKINIDEDYKMNPLRIYLEQKDGAGDSEILPYEKYKSKLKNKDYNPERLKRVLKKFEFRISSILSFNCGNTVFTDSIKSTKVPFSKGYITIQCNTYVNRFKFLNSTRITQTFFSDCTTNLILTVHRLNVVEKRCLVCLWDISAANQESQKILVVIDDIIVGKFHGKSDGIFVAALDDGTINLWDLSEEATWRNDNVANENDSTNFAEINAEGLTEFEKDREWNIQNSHTKNDMFNISNALNASSYTNSGTILTSGEVPVDRTVGLEFTTRDTIAQDGGRKIIGQVISLQRVGILTTWNIVQDRSKNPSKDLGKAYWSKLILEKSQSINLSDHIHHPIKNNEESSDCFDLTLAKRRLYKMKKEKKELNSSSLRPKSATNFEYDIDRPSSAASVKSVKKPKELQVEKNNFNDTVICNHLKLLMVDDYEYMLVAKGSGEVVCCRKSLGDVKVKKIRVASDTSSITSLEVSPLGLPYFLAATDTGTVNLCSIVENRVLLTLDCGNIPAALEIAEKCKSDNKGRYLGSVSRRTSSTNDTELLSMNIAVKTVLWSPVNPCCLYALLKDERLLAWDLTSSDIYGKYGGQNATALIAGNSALGLLTPEGDVQIHHFAQEQQIKGNLVLFKKYVALL